ASLSLLELMACYGSEGQTLAVLDAGRGECYCGEYDVREQRAQLVREFLCSRGELIEFATEKNIMVIACEQSILAFLREQGISAKSIRRPDSASAVVPGFKKLVAGETIDVEHLDANYIRRSDAEIFSRPKLDAKKHNS